MTDDNVPSADADDDRRRRRVHRGRRVDRHRAPEVVTTDDAETPVADEAAESETPRGRGLE